MIKVELRELGTIEYQSCYNQMIDLINESPQFHSIWVLEHEPVFTLGISEKEIQENHDHNPPIVKTDRGGKITYHGPGQQVFYFIFDLKQLPFKPSELTKNLRNHQSVLS